MWFNKIYSFKKWYKKNNKRKFCKREGDDQYIISNNHRPDDAHGLSIVEI